MVILTIIFSLQGWVFSIGLKSIPVLDISAPSLLPTLNSGIHPGINLVYLNFGESNQELKMIIFMCVFDF